MRALEVRVKERNVHKFIKMFGGTKTTKNNWICSMESNSETLHNALHTCQHLLLKNNGQLSSKNRAFLKAREESSHNSTRRGQVVAWCDDFVIATLGNGYSEAAAAQKADKRGVGGRPSTEHGSMLDKLVKAWKHRRDPDILLCNVSLLAFLFAGTWKLSLSI